MSGSASKTLDKPNTINIKLEPLELGDPDWLFARLGGWLLLEVRDAPPVTTPMEQAIEDMLKT